MVCTNLKAQHKHPLIYGSCCSILILLSLQIFHYKNLKLEHEGVVRKRQRGMNNFLMFNSDKVMCQQGWRVTIPIVDIINVKLIRCILLLESAMIVYTKCSSLHITVERRFNNFIARQCDDCIYKMQLVAIIIIRPQIRSPNLFTFSNPF